MRYCFFILLLLAGCVRTPTPEWQDSPEIAAIFKAAKIQGTFVLYDVTNNKLIGYDQTRAAQRFVPASTFKIPNSLIGLSVGAVKNVDEILPYGNQPQPLKDWEKDMNLRDAIKISNVPIFQELARRIGLERMRTAIVKLDYGNAEIGNTVDIFWLQGPLKISAIEQTHFLARLANNELPFPKEAQTAVHDITKVEQQNDWTLYAKTGTAMRSSPVIGWWVGWVKKANRVYTFALNIDMPNLAQDSPKRIELGRTCLHALHVLD